MPSDPLDPPPPPLPHEPSEDPLVGTVVAGKYRVEAAVARGGMGRIYRAVQEPLGRVVALKTLLTHAGAERDATLEKRFLLEAATCARLTHANTVSVFDYGSLRVAGEDTLFMVMEFVEGRTLAQAIKADGPFPPARALRVAREIARSLREAHGLGIVHRDLKPSNVMLVQRDDGESVKVLDFGVAKVIQEGSETLTSTGSFVGSPRYTAPEQIRQEHVDGRCDLYALGCVMYDMLVGAPPFASGEPMRTLLAHLQDPVPAMSARARQEIPEAVERLVMRCLEKDRDDRPADAAAFLALVRDAEDAIGAERTSGTGTLPALRLDAVPSAPDGAAADPSASRRHAGGAPGASGGGASPAADEPSGTMAAASAPASVAVSLPVKAFVGAVGVIALVAALAAAFVLTRPPAEAPRVVAAPPAEVPAAAGTLVVTSAPSGATVFDGERRLGRTPLDLPSGQDRVLRFRLEGHEDAQVAVGADDRTAHAALDPARAARPRPQGASRPPSGGPSAAPPADDIRVER